ncbi:hypothetical protein [Actinomadura sp.]|jgi:hypothetical protein|uniref:hypothetical protein n=1 Tax=Actinomadura sp. TaxID=1989 RepID=UPI0033615C2B
MVSWHNKIEKELLEHLKSGHVTPFAPAMGVPASERTIRAGVLRGLLTDPDVKRLHPPLVSLEGVIIEGRLSLNGLECEVNLFLVGCVFREVLELSFAHLPRLVLAKSKLVGMEAAGVRIDNGLDARFVECAGTVRLSGARIGGQTDFTGARLVSAERSALEADGFRADGDLLLRTELRTQAARADSEFCARAAEDAVRLIGAQISGDLDLIGARLEAERGPALTAERVRVGGSALFQAVKAASMLGDEPAARDGVSVLVLKGAVISGELSLDKAKISSAQAGALAADNIRVGGDAFLRNMRAIGSDPEGVVRLLGAHVEGSLKCHGGVMASHSGNQCSLDLRFATLHKALYLKPDFLRAGSADKVNLDGLKYAIDLPEAMDRREWIAFLRARVPYAAQPYRQLADVYKAAGREEDARRVLIAQQDHLLASGNDIPPFEKFRLRALKITVGYGYRMSRPLAGLALTTVAAIAMVVVSAATTDAVRLTPVYSNQVKASATAHPGGAGAQAAAERCTLVDQVGLGIELSVPLINTTTRVRCNIIASSKVEQLIVAAGWIFQVLGWMFAALFAAGVAKTIRED